MLSILFVRLTIKVKVGMPESFKLGWYPPKKNWVESPLYDQISRPSGGRVMGFHCMPNEVLRAPFTNYTAIHYYFFTFF